MLCSPSPRPCLIGVSWSVGQLIIKKNNRTTAGKRKKEKNRRRPIYQYSNMASRLSGQNCKSFKFSLSNNSQKRLGYKDNTTEYRSLSWKPRSHVRILIYRTWPIDKIGWIGASISYLQYSFLTAHAHLTKRECFATAGQGKRRRWVQECGNLYQISLWACADQYRFSVFYGNFSDFLEWFRNPGMGSSGR